MTRPGRNARGTHGRRRISDCPAVPPAPRRLLVGAFLCCGWLLLVANAQAQSSQTRGAVLVFGNSLTAGHGLDPSQAYPALLQQKIDSLGWLFRVVNAGLSGETSAGGRRRIAWMLRQPVVVFILELGGNDGLRGIPLAETEKNLQAILDSVRHKNPGAALIVAGMQVPPNLGEAYTGAFAALFPVLARRNHAALIPFLLEGVGGDPALNLPDRIHPNAAGHKIVAENVWRVLRPVLEAIRRRKVGE